MPKRLENKMRQIYSNTFATDQSQEIRWVLNQTHLPNGEQLIQEWKPQAECLLKDFLSFSYCSSKLKANLTTEHTDSTLGFFDIFNQKKGKSA